MKIETGKIYRHYKKGDRYKVLKLAKHSETQEEMVVYQAQYGDKGIWVRPVSMWDDFITESKRTSFGQSIRFKLDYLTLSELEEKNKGNQKENEEMSKTIDNLVAHFNSDEQKAKREQQYIETLPLAIEYIRNNTDKCGVMQLSRHFRIPWHVATRILDTMEAEEMIGAWTGGSVRKVFIK